VHQKRWPVSQGFPEPRERFTELAVKGEAVKSVNGGECHQLLHTLLAEATGLFTITTALRAAKSLERSFANPVLEKLVAFFSQRIEVPAHVGRMKAILGKSFVLEVKVRCL